MLALSPPELLDLLTTLPADRTAFVWGPPGIGKSALVRATADRLGLPCVVLLGTQIAPEDLIGVPRIRETTPGRFATEFCPPGAILRASPFLMFVDELNSAIPDVQKAFYSLILDRRLGDYVLPEGSRVVAAGNRVEDRALVRPMATALANRMVHVALEPSAEAWLGWATGANVHPLVLAFIRARADRLCESPPSDLTPAYPTPRAWHMLADAIAATNARLWPAIAAGSVGDRAGAEFAAFAVRALEAPTLEAVARGEASVPRDPELVYFLGASCLARLASNAPDDGELAAKVVIALGGVSKEVAVWAIDAALSRKPSSPAALAFEGVLRTSGAQTLVDVLRLSRYAREG
ncbi:MAG TPA: MoxR family ATPase [Polyangiaceae bacterium]|nr:MoxR family ATPase [Polyangiaceae bacterium]